MCQLDHPSKCGRGKQSFAIDSQNEWPLIIIVALCSLSDIVRIEEVYESTNEIYIVQELCLGGELFDRLDEQPDYHYTEPQCARLVKQMLSAVRYLHSKGIIHRGA